MANQSRTVRTAKSYITFPVAAAAYGKRFQLHNGVSHTHSYDPAAEHVLCGKVKAVNILEDYALVTEGELPSCPTCAARLARLAAKEVQ